MNRSQELLKKLQALRDAPGTAGEGKAAQAAIDRINKRLGNDGENISSKPIENKSSIKGDNNISVPHGFYAINGDEPYKYYGPYSKEDDALSKSKNMLHYKKGVSRHVYHSPNSDSWVERNKDFYTSGNKAHTLHPNATFPHINKQKG